MTSTTNHYLADNVRATKFYGTTGLGTGPFIGDGANVTNIPRANLIAGTADYVVINAPVTGLLSQEQRLAVSRAGLGSTTAPNPQWSAMIGNVRPSDSAAVYANLPAIIGADTGIFNPLSASVTAVANTLVMRDASGNIPGSGTTISQSVSSMTTINTSGPSISYIATGYARTTSNAAIPMFTITPDGANSGNFSIEIITTCVKSIPNIGVTGTMRVLTRASYDASGASWGIHTPFIEEHKSTEASIATATITMTSGGGNLIINVAGVVGSTLDWTGQVRIVYERMLAP